MSGTPYKIKQEAALIFSFESVGNKGTIEKIVRYDKIGEDLYNLAFGDRIENSFDIDDKIVTDNGDTRKVMVTVISTLSLFFDTFPNSQLFFQGSNQKRTNFYGWIISNYLEEFEKTYQISGVRNNAFENVMKNIEYDYFLIRKLSYE